MYGYLGLGFIIMIMSGIIWVKDQRINTLVAERDQAKAEVSAALATLAQQEQAVQHLLAMEKLQHLRAKKALEEAKKQVTGIQAEIERIRTFTPKETDNDCENTRNLLRDALQ